jgi:hypothetical protein
MDARLPVAALLAVLLAVSPGMARTADEPGPPLRFEDFPAGALYAGHGRLVLGPADRAFRTRLREAARQPPDFAGHYVLALWGCGTECIMGAAINLRSGRVAWLPGTLCCWYKGGQGETQEIEPVHYRRDSRLIVLNGMRNEREGDLGTHLYAMEGGRFVHLLDLPPGAGKP